MKYQTLYQESQWKRHHQRVLEQEKTFQIKQMSSCKKINVHSHNILANKISEKLSLFLDDSILNIQTSIPLLHATQLLRAIESIESAKQKLHEGEFENSRLKEQARFVYCLWKMIDEEQIEARQLKQIIYMLNDKQPAQLVSSLSQMYSNDEAVKDFVETWKTLMRQNQYYRSIERIQKKKKGKEGKEGEKIAQNDKLALKQFNLDERNNVQSYLSSKKLNSSSKMMTLASTQLSKNKENYLIDRLKQQEAINRLYQIQKYKVREIQKQLEDQKKQKQMFESCTFKPQLINDRLRSISANKRSSSINGYNKAVHRMKVGVEKAKIEKEKKEYKPVGENYQKLRDMKPNPPKFLSRKKEEDPVQFMIEFDLGRHKVKIKIHASDQEEKIASNLCKIYCLKQDYFEQICLIIRKERELYEADQCF